MNTSQLVSILLLTYNSEAFIEETLESIFSQDYPNIEIIIGDDNSTDNTVSIIQSKKSNSPYKIIEVYSDKNEGISVNFNKCLLQCSGKYIFLLGGDDIFMDGKITAQVSFMESNMNCMISYHDVSVFESSTKKELYKFNKDKHGFHKGGVDLIIKQGTFNCGCATAVRNTGKLPFCDERITYASDWLWYIDILATNDGNINYIDGIYAKYRRHNNNITSNNFIEKQIHEVLLTLDICEEKYPRLITFINTSRSERLLAFSIKFLLAKKYKQFFYYLRLSFKHDHKSILYVAKRFFLKKI